MFRTGSWRMFHPFCLGNDSRTILINKESNFYDQKTYRDTRAVFRMQDL